MYKDFHYIQVMVWFFHFSRPAGTHSQQGLTVAQTTISYSRPAGTHN